MQEKTSKYRQIAEQLRSEILGGRYAGRSFPSEVMLSRRFATGRSTVKRALDELHYMGLVYSRQGRGTFVTKHGSSRKIGLLLSGLTYSEYFQPIATAFMRLARDNGYSLCFGAIQSSDPQSRIREAREIVADFIRNQVAGVVYHPLDYSFDEGAANRHILDVLKKAAVPVVLFDSDIVEAPQRSEYDLVSIDNVLAGELLARHLIDSGAKNIHFLLRPTWIPNALNRIRGVMCASISAGLGWSKENVLMADPTDVDLVRRHFRRRSRPDAFVCENDTLAAVFRTSLEKLRIDVPRQVLLAGFDDVNIARLLSPSLTSIRQPCDLIARTAFARLLERIEKPEMSPVEIYLPATLSVRDSTRPLRGAR